MNSKVYKAFVTYFTIMERKEEILDVATLSSKFQITITKPVRNSLNLKAGDRVVFIKRGDEIILRKA